MPKTLINPVAVQAALAGLPACTNQALGLVHLWMNEQRVISMTLIRKTYAGCLSLTVESRKE